MTISEPSTLVTDLILSGSNLWFGLAAARQAGRTRQRSIFLWATAILSGGAAALLGGVYHGFGPAMGAPDAAVLWTVTVWLVGISSLTGVWGSLVAVVRGPWRGALIGLAWLKFAAYAVWMAGHEEFRYVVYDQTIALMAILVLHVRDALAGREPSSRFMATAVLVSVAGAFVQLSGLDLHRHFNHNDLFHVVQIAANYLFYRGALLLRDEDSPSASR